MRKIVLASLLVLVAATANAGVIYDIQTGAVEEGTLQTPYDVVVTAVAYNGVWVAEEPYAEYNGIWVYLGSDDPIEFVAGDLVRICAEYKEYYDLTELDVVSAGLYGSIIKTGEATVPTPSFVFAADIVADGEPWESCVITVIDGMEVTEEPSSYGEWFATALDGSVLMFDDIFYDDSTVMLGDCYNNATGVLNYNYGNFKLEAFADGIEVTDCSVGTEDATFSSMKALFR